MLTHMGHALPLIPLDPLDTVVLSQRCIQKGVVRINEIKHGTIVAEHVLKEQHRLFVHVVSQRGEFWVEFFVLVIVLIKVTQV